MLSAKETDDYIELALLRIDELIRAATQVEEYDLQTWRASLKDIEDRFAEWAATKPCPIEYSNLYRKFPALKEATIYLSALIDKAQCAASTTMCLPDENPFEAYRSPLLKGHDREEEYGKRLTNYEEPPAIDEPPFDDMSREEILEWFAKLLEENSSSDVDDDPVIVTTSDTLAIGELLRLRSSEEIVEKYLENVRPRLLACLASTPSKEKLTAHVDHETGRDDPNAASGIIPLQGPQIIGNAQSSQSVIQMDDSFEPMTHALVKDRMRHRQGEKPSWSAGTAKDSRRSIALFSRFVSEMYSINRIQDLRHRHLIEFRDFLSSEIYLYHGKSEHDHSKSIAYLRNVASTKPKELRGVTTTTLGKHMGAIRQLLEYAADKGVELDQKIALDRLAPRGRSATRGRNARPKLKTENVKKIFSQPVFNGCAGWEKEQLLTPGPYIFHRGLYWIPLLANYTGARREELCGMYVNDVVSGNGAPSYIRIAANKERGLKNPQSERSIPLHDEVLRLGFLEYVEAIETLGYTLLFPDLKSPTSASPMGDRFYDEFKPVLNASGITEKGIATHAFRHEFGNNLKQNKVEREGRADLLGHQGEDPTTEEYCEAYWVKIAREFIELLPNVTENLQRSPIRLLPWVESKEKPPFSQPSRSKEAKLKRRRFAESTQRELAMSMGG